MAKDTKTSVVQPLELISYQKMFLRTEYGLCYAVHSALYDDYGYVSLPVTESWIFENQNIA